MKKTIAYVLIAVVAIGAIYYFYTQKNSSGLGSAGAGATPFEKDDDAAYNSMRALIPAGDLPWVEKHVKERYDTTPEMIGGQKSKAATFLKTIGAVAPNTGGKYPAVSWSNGMPLLWPIATIDQMWNIQNNLSAKYNKL